MKLNQQSTPHTHLYTYEPPFQNPGITHFNVEKHIQPFEQDLNVTKISECQIL